MEAKGQVLRALALGGIMMAGNAIAQEAKDAKAGGAPKEDAVMCFGVNDCSGRGECAGKVSGCSAPGAGCSMRLGCKGKNSCKGKGLKKMAGKKACEDKGGKVAEKV